MEILIGIGAFAVFGLFMYCISAFVWASAINKTSPRITFGAFKKVYAISPTKWSLSFENVGYHSDDGWIYVEFKHYTDVLRYGIFKDKIEKDEAYLQKIQNEKKFLASVQNDIDSYRRENLAELERIINDTQSNAENILQKAEVNSGGDDY